MMMEERETVYVHPSREMDFKMPTKMDVDRPTGDPISLQELVVNIADILGDPKYDKENPQHVERVRLLMESYAAEWNEWKRYEFWDDEKNYTRNLIATDNKTFTLMLLCWNPNKSSPIHAHEGSNCWMRMVDGTCKETRYLWPKSVDSPMEQSCCNDVQAPSCAFICDKLGLHKVGNPCQTGAVSLHLYSPPFESCQVFLDPKCGKPSTSHVTFYSEHGEKVDFH